MTQQYDEANDVFYITHSTDEFTAAQIDNFEASSNPMGYNNWNSARQNRVESRINAKIDETLNEIAGLQYGDIEQFGRSGSNQNYVRITTENENIIWLPEIKFKKYMRAVELKCRWWFQRLGDKLFIHIVEPNYTENEIAILKKRYTEPVSGQIAIKRDGTISIHHNNVAYILEPMYSSELRCLYNDYPNNKCPLKAKIAPVFNKMMISIRNPVEAQEIHKEHDTTPLPPPPPSDLVPLAEFIEIIGSSETTNNTENDKYPLCTVSTNGEHLWCQGIKFTRHYVTTYRSYVNGTTRAGTVLKNSKGQNVFRENIKKTIDINQCDQVTLTSDNKIKYMEHTFAKQKNRGEWRCRTGHAAGVRQCNQPAHVYRQEDGSLRIWLKE